MAKKQISMGEFAERMVVDLPRQECEEFINDPKRVIPFLDPNSEPPGKFLIARKAAIKVLNEYYTGQLKAAMKGLLHLCKE